MHLRNILTWALALLVGGFVLLWSWVKVQEQYGIFHPVKLTPRQDPGLPDEFERVEFSGQQGRLSGIWREGADTEPAVVFFHGNAGHAFHRVQWISSILPDGWNGFVFDYRGYGLSEGTPSEQGVYRDAKAALDYVRNRLDHDRIIYHGRSMGVPVAAHAMGHHCPSGVVFESGFPDARSMAKTILPLPGISWFLSVNFDTVGAVNGLSEACRSVPKMVVHGESDRVVPTRLGRDLHERLPPPKQITVLPRLGHNDPRSSNSKYVDGVRDFYRGAVTPNGDTNSGKQSNSPGN